MADAFEHVPVLLEEVLQFLEVRPGALYVDCTLGGGGHARAIMERSDGRARLIGIDRDPQAILAARQVLEPFGENVRIVQGNFKDLATLLDDVAAGQVDGILADLGVSSHQLDTAERGFSYHNEPLDMRMGPDAPHTAAELLEQLEEDELVHILRTYGEERWAHRIAKAIVRRRAQRPIQTATDLAEIVKHAIPAAARRSGPHPARRSFQALRIAVNDELEALRRFLSVAVERLAPGGRIVVISFHSLEDRIVKQAFLNEARGCICPPELPVCACHRTPRLHILTRKPVVATKDEIEANPRARSAKLRAAMRVLPEGVNE